MVQTCFQAILIVLFVSTGALNTLTAKWADRTLALSMDGEERYFHHPYFQSLCMFFSEMCCLAMFKGLFIYYRHKDALQDEKALTKGSREFSRLLLLPPALCDMISTMLMLIGLILTYASSYQMLRGSVIIFVAIFARIFLHQILILREYVGIILVIFGLAFVSVADADIFHYDKDLDESDNVTIIEEDIGYVFLGDMLIIGANLFAAIQFVWEEKFVSGLDIPALQAVGWEGVFGFVLLGFLMIPFHFIRMEKPFSDNSRGTIEDLPDVFVQMGNKPNTIIAMVLYAVSIAFYNYAGVSVTKELSSTTRTVLDSLRTFIIWMVSLFLIWETFDWIQLVGFILLILGNFIYNNILILQTYSKCAALLRIKRSNSEQVQLKNETQRANVPGAAVDNNDGFAVIVKRK